MAAAQELMLGEVLPPLQLAFKVQKHLSCTCDLDSVSA